MGISISSSLTNSHKVQITLDSDSVLTNGVIGSA